MTDNLKALSDAATQGVWRVVDYDAGSYIYDAGGFSTPSIECEEADCAIVHWDGFKQEHWVSANGNAKQIAANARLMTELVNAYRADLIRPVPVWQPIESAPRDGTRILLAHKPEKITESYHKQVGEGLFHSHYDWAWANDSCSCCYSGMLEGDPDYWQPLPTPPASGASDEN